MAVHLSLSKVKQSAFSRVALLRRGQGRLRCVEGFIWCLTPWSIDWWNNWPQYATVPGFNSFHLRDCQCSGPLNLGNLLFQLCSRDCSAFCTCNMTRFQASGHAVRVWSLSFGRCVVLCTEFIRVNTYAAPLSLITNCALEAGRINN